MNLKIFSLIFLAHVAIAIEVLKFDLSQNDKNLIEALKTVRIGMVKTYALKGYNFISIPDPQIKDYHEAMRLGFIQGAFNTESVRICYNNFTFANQNRNSVILIDNIDVFRQNAHRINAKVFRSMGLHMIVLLHGNFEDVHEIFDTFWSKTIFNVMALMNKNKTVLLSFEPFADSQKCGDTSPKIINSFENGNFIKNLDLRRTFDNLNRCPITVTTYLDAVAVLKESQPNGSFILRGHDIHLIETISKMLNFTLMLKFRDGTQEWGAVYENGTCTKAFSDLKERRTDILIGNLYLKESRMQYFENSIQYLNYPIFFVLSPERKLNGFEKLLSPLQSFVWIALLLTFCCGVAVIFIINIKYKFLKKFVYGDKVKHPITNLFAALIGLPQTAVPKRNFARFILMMFLILSLIIRSVYQGFLYKFLQSDGRHKEPQTISELIEKEYIFISSETSFEMAKKYHPKMYAMAKIVEGTVEKDLDKFVTLAERTATLVSLPEFIHYSMHHKKFSYKICKENFYTMNVAIYFNKNFFLKRPIDEAIRRILPHGFMKHWVREFDRSNRWKFRDKKPMNMTLEHLAGAFNLLLIGNLIGFLIFLVEKLIWKFKN